jgi:hypothetical protein
MDNNGGVRDWSLGVEKEEIMTDLQRKYANIQLSWLCRQAISYNTKKAKLCLLVLFTHTPSVIKFALEHSYA